MSEQNKDEMDINLMASTNETRWATLVDIGAKWFFLYAYFCCEDWGTGVVRVKDKSVVVINCGEFKQYCTSDDKLVWLELILQLVSSMYKFKLIGFSQHLKNTCDLNWCVCTICFCTVPSTWAHHSR